MVQPWWKRALSYIKDIEIESSESGLNPFLRVVLKRGEYQLQTANAIYSYGHLYDNFAQIFDKIDFERARIQNVLILGFGLGSIPLLLEARSPRPLHFTAVEIDPEVLRLANRYVVPQIASSIDFNLLDAATFARFCEDRFDLICMDVFLDDVVPTELEQDDFLHDLQQLLAPDGLLLFNKLAYTKHDKKEAQQFFQHHFKRIFTDGVCEDVNGNYILINRRDLLK